MHFALWMSFPNDRGTISGMREFSAVDCIRFGWSLFKRRAWFLVGMTALMIVLSWAIGGMAGLFGERDISGLAGGVVYIALSTFLSMGFTAVVIRAHDMLESVEVNDLWHPKPFWKFLAAQLLSSIVVLIGFILLIVPGIIAILMYLFVPYLVIDKEFGPIEALKKSAELTRGYRWELLLLVLFIVTLNILGALALLVGLLVSVPVTMLATVHAYRMLEAKLKPASVT